MASIVTVHTIEKIPTGEKRNGRPSGIMIPIWKDYDPIPRIVPRFVYMMTCAPGRQKGPYLHTKRRGLLTLAEGRVRLVYQEGHTFREVDMDAGEKAVMADISAGTGYLIKNPSPDREAVFIVICDYPWRKADQEMVVPDFSGYVQDADGYKG